MIHFISPTRRFVTSWLILCVLVVRVSAAPPQFEVEAIDAENECAAGVALDINLDGKTDILCGDYWYEAPTWKRHFARQTQRIRGRFDDYSNLPLDVDGDGHLDVVSCNYRSQSIYWLRHPGPAGGVWQRTVVSEPGAMETGRLADVDGDGKMDVLPNGTQFAAWWSVAEGDSGQPVWTRHDLPAEAAGHGIGFGDIDGDGRGDIVTPRGWFRRDPEQTDRWQWLPEFALHRDAGLPILVHDIDRDGDADILWGRGHQCGLYWLEQRLKGKERRWQQHTIDTELTQVHSLLLGDLDGDGHDDLVAGKRYHGHDGKDIGEQMPMRVDGYSFQPASRTFQRFPISRHYRAAVGLDPKLTDIDGDGDLDVLLPDRSGLFVAWNRGERSGEDVARPEASPTDWGPPPTPAELLVGRPVAAGEPARKIQRADQWGRRREAILKQMQEVMGPLPGPQKRCPLDVEFIQSTRLADGITRHQLTYQAEPGDRVPAYVFVPQQEEGKRFPAMLCLHQTTAIGKGEPAGLGGRPELHYALELARRGYVCIVPDYPSFGDYRDYDFAADDYVSGSMKAIWNNHRAVDLLETLPQVDPDRIGCIGHSLGGHNALFTAALDQRLKVTITSCGFTAFHDYYGGNLAGWTSPRYMPRIREQYENDPDKMPFDFYGVLGAIAPRGIFINAPLNDSNFAVAGVRQVVDRVKEIYPLFPVSHGIEVRYPDAGHGFPDAVREESYRWLDQKLRR